MKLQYVASLVSMVGLALVACGGDSGTDAYCDKQEECAKTAGTGFSVTDCKQSAVSSKEKADTKGCSSEYDDTSSCVAGISFECADFIGDGANKKIIAECGAKSDKLQKCLE